jgi:hypothetical protein
MALYLINVAQTNIIRQINAKDVPSAKYKFTKVTGVDSPNLIIKIIK